MFYLRALLICTVLEIIAYSRPVILLKNYLLENLKCRGSKLPFTGGDNSEKCDDISTINNNEERMQTGKKKETTSAKR
jgi:hypothetical protein